MEGGELVRHEEQPTITPMALIDRAVQQGASVEQLQQLFELKLRVEADEARKAYVVAIGRFKENAPTILKGKAVAFGNTKYKHATLDDASERIGKALSECGISHRWDVKQEGGVISVTCILTHVQGHSESVTMQAAPDTSGSKNSIQAVGSAVSYLQRYTLFASTGLAAKDSDDDGRGGAGGLDARQVADYSAAIDELTDRAAGERLWKQIADACSKAGDVASYESLKSAMAKRIKALPAKEAAL